MKPEPIAILCSDLHLTLRPPPCRKDDWMEVQARYLGQLKSLACTVAELWLGNRNTTGRPVPVLCAGDIFDKWNPPPEIIQFALKHLPDGMICVPGQHDLPNHRMEEMRRSAYGVLVEAGKIRCASSHRRLEVPSRSHISMGKWNVYGFGWGEEVTGPVIEGPALALVHKYIWTIEASYPGAPKEAHLSSIAKDLRPYKVAVFGDNHKGFLKKLKTGTTVLNSGGFIIRKSDEIGYKPSVGILYEDGSVVRQALDTRKDKFRSEKEMAEVIEVDMSDFVEELSRLGEGGLDFRESVQRALNGMKIPGPVKEKVLACLT